MKNKILCVMVVLLSVILIGVVRFRKESNFSFEEKKEETSKESEEVHFIKIYDPTTQKISQIDIEEYIIGVVAAEMPASFEIEALKAQAVAARSFAIYKQEYRKEEYDVIKGISDQAYNTIEEMKNKWKDKFLENYAKIKSSVEATKGEVLTYQNKVIEAFYFSMSNGYTEKCELVFQEQLPYIESVESSWDNETITNYEVTKTFSKEEFCKLLNISCEQLEINQIIRTDSKRVSNITINNVTFKGTELRKLLTLRSTDFDIDINEFVSITTRGSGHGVGMSQYGANGMAKEGNTYQNILKYFYQNIEILKI